MKKKTKKIKITKVNASFSINKNLSPLNPNDRFERIEQTNIWFSAEAEVLKGEKPEKVAEQVHNFCKKLAVEKYNSFSRKDLLSTPSDNKSPEEEYESTAFKGEMVDLGGGKGVFPKKQVFKHKPFKYQEPVYISTERGENEEANKVLLTDEMREKNTQEPI